MQETRYIPVSFVACLFRGAVMDNAKHKLFKQNNRQRQTNLPRFDLQASAFR